MKETSSARLGRLKMRSWRRGMREMDMILGPFADAHLNAMGAGELESFDSLLNENDQDLFEWVTGRGIVPDQYGQLIGQIAAWITARAHP